MYLTSYLIHSISCFSLTFSWGILSSLFSLQARLFSFDGFLNPLLLGRLGVLEELVVPAFSVDIFQRLELVHESNEHLLLKFLTLLLSQWRSLHADFLETREVAQFWQLSDCGDRITVQYQLFKLREAREITE